MLNFNVLTDYLTLNESNRMMMKLASNVNTVPALGTKTARSSLITNELRAFSISYQHITNSFSWMVLIWDRMKDA